MISLYLSVSGGQLASELANDPEEMAYALTELAKWDGEEMGREVAWHLMADDADVVAAFLRAMAEQIEQAGVQ